MMDNQAWLYAISIKAENNYASRTAGVMQVLTYSSVEIYDSQFNENEADQGSCFNILQPSVVSECTL
jgi:hypothetical protein